MSNADMNENDATADASSEELVRILARRAKRGRARSTSLLIAVLLVLVGVLLGIGIGRATAPGGELQGPGTSEQGDAPRGGPFGGRPRD